jgi:hypothetical protein
MPLAESIFSRLRSVGTLAGESIFPSIAPAGQAAPYIVWQLIASRPDTTLGEASASGIHIIQFSCVAATYKQARDLGAEVIAAIDNVTLESGEQCFSCNEQDGYSDATDQYLRIVEAEFFTAIQPAT